MTRVCAVVVLSVLLIAAAWADWSDCVGPTTSNGQKLDCPGSVDCGPQIGASCKQRTFSATGSPGSQQYLVCACQNLPIWEPPCCHLRLYITPLPPGPSVIVDPRPAGSCAACDVGGICMVCPIDDPQGNPTGNFQPACIDGSECP